MITMYCSYYLPLEKKHRQNILKDFHVSSDTLPVIMPNEKIAYRQPAAQIY